MENGGWYLDVSTRKQGDGWLAAPPTLLPLPSCRASPTLLYSHLYLSALRRLRSPRFAGAIRLLLTQYFFILHPIVALKIEPTERSYIWYATSTLSVFSTAQIWSFDIVQLADNFLKLISSEVSQIKFVMEKTTNSADSENICKSEIRLFAVQMADSAREQAKSSPRCDISVWIAEEIRLWCQSHRFEEQCFCLDLPVCTNQRLEDNG